MTKKEFAQIVASKTGVTPKEALNFVNAFDEIMVNEIFKKEDSVKFSFGTLAGITKKTSERTARNPKDGSQIIVPARVFKGLPKLKISKTMKESCQE